MSLYSTPIQLHDIENAETFARMILNKTLPKLGEHGAYLNPTEYEDALSYLVGVAWRLSQRYDPTRGYSFSTFAHLVLPKRVKSWYRQRFHDLRYAGRRNVTFTPLPDRDDALGEADALLDALSSIDIAPLSPVVRRIHRHIALPMALRGLTREQIADEIGWSRKAVSDALDEWRAELEAKCLAAA